MNKAILIGRLTKDPELRYTNSNRPVTQVSLAITRPFSNQNGEREADFINVVIWDKNAENVCKYMTKGRLVAVEGRIQTRNYDNAEGKKVYITEVVAQNVQFLESKNGGSANVPQSNDNPFDYNDSNSNAETISVQSDPFENFGNSVDLSDNDLPF